MKELKSVIRLSYRIPLVFLWTVFMFIICVAVINTRVRSYIERTYFRVLLKILKIQIRLNKPIKDKGVVIVANHISYTDIMVLHSLFHGYFVAKAEVKDWPIYGWAASLIRTIFVERGKHGTMDHLRKEGSKVLQRGENLIIFPEGTSSKEPMRPFKKGAFLLAKDNNAPIIPVTLKYSNLEKVAWYGDMTFPSHLLDFLSKASKEEVTVSVMPKIHSFYFDDEEQLLDIVKMAMQKVYDDDSLKAQDLESLDIFGLEARQNESLEPEYSAGQ